MMIFHERFVSKYCYELPMADFVSNIKKNQNKQSKKKLPWSFDRGGLYQNYIITFFL